MGTVSAIQVEGNVACDWLRGWLRCGVSSETHKRVKKKKRPFQPLLKGVRKLQINYSHCQRDQCRMSSVGMGEYGYMGMAGIALSYD